VNTSHHAEPSGALLQTIGRALGPGFEVGRELGGGGMARVFVVRDLALGRSLAMKVFAPERSGSMSGERFRREIVTVAKLQHPNIVPLLSTGDADGIPYFLMPYIEGASLRSAIRPEGTPVAMTVRVLTDVVRALSYAHASGVVHRDIKPDNILLSGDTAVVTDFGVAKAVSVALGPETPAGQVAPLTQTGMSFGTPVYMAPEQVAADPSADHRVDFYALGVTAYEMLCGAAPFHGETPQALLAAKLTRAPPSISLRRTDVSDGLEAIVMRCLEVDADSRPTHASEILDALSDPAVLGSGALVLSGLKMRRAIARRVNARRVGVAALIGLAATAIVWTSASSRQQDADASPAAAAAAAAIAAGGEGGGPGTSPAQTSTPSAGALDPRAIAVIPFVDLVGSSDTARFAVSLSESVRSGLAASPELRIAASSVTLAALQAGGDVREAARRLGTGFVLTGTIDREGNALRLSIQLVSAADGLSRWATTIDGEANRRFDFERRVAKDITQSVVAAILGDSAAGLPPSGSELQ
jgi:TolB-like protein